MSAMRFRPSKIILLILSLLIHLLPSCALAGNRQTFVYAVMPGVPQDHLLIDLYPCSQSSSALVIYVHGGAWILGDKANVHTMPDFFARHNVCFASVNYPLNLPADGSLIDTQLAALSSLDEWLQLEASRRGPNSPYQNVSLIGHSAGAHLVALLDKQTGWNDKIRNIVLMDSAAYDLQRKFSEAKPQFRKLLSSLLRLDAFPVASRKQVLAQYSPALLPPKPRKNLPLNIFLLSGLTPASHSSALSLQRSYRYSSDHNIFLYNLPWQHSEFPRKIGTDPGFSQKLLSVIQP